MLPPFQLRDVRRSSSSPPPASHSSPTISSSEPLVKLTAPEYDNTITAHPEATLKYVDEDDGEIVTVGTSLELSQRLEDPLPRTSDPTQLYHKFDVDRKEDVVKIWQCFAERTNDIDCKERPSKLEMYKAHLNGLESYARSEIGAVAKPSEQHISKGNDGPKLDDVEERRKQYFRACDPPQLQDIKHDDASSRLFPNPKHTSLNTLTRKTMGLSDSTAVASILTQEGKRQARAAGERLRAFPHSGRASSSLDHLDYQNRWASYNHSKLSIPSEHGPTQSTIGNSHNRQAQWAGDKIRGRTNRMRHAKSSIELSAQDTKKVHSSVNDQPLAVQFEITTPSSVRPVPGNKPETGAPNLLQVFNSAFDKGMEAAASTKASMGDNRFETTDPCRYATYLESRNKRPSPKSSSSKQISQSIKNSVDEVARVVAELQLQTSTSENSQLARQVAQTLESSLKDALSKFDLCLNSIARSAQEASDARENKTRPATDANIGDSGDDLLGPSKNITVTRLNSHSQSEVQPSSAECRTPQEEESVLPRKQASSTCNPGRTSSLRCHGPAPIHSFEGNTSASDHLAALALPKIAHASTPQAESTYKPRESAPGAGYHSALPRRRQPKSSGPYYVGWDDSVPADARTANAPVVARTVTESRGQNVAPSYDQPTKAFTATNNPFVPKFPPLPSMEPLQPLQSAPRPYESSASNADGFLQQASAGPIPGWASLTGPPPTTTPRCENPMKGIPSQPFPPGDISSSTCYPFPSESSGNFFNRMTGRDAGAAQFEASIQPSDLCGPGNTDGLRRSATIAGLNNKYTTSSRRPYSINYDGNGRTPWTHFLSSRPSRAQRSPPASDCATTASSNGMRDLSPRLSMPGSFPQPKATTEERANESSLKKAQNCAKHLQDLGFGDVVDGGPERLMVYAQAAEGDLVNAIDMIDEEQKAYKEHRYH